MIGQSSVQYPLKYQYLNIGQKRNWLHAYSNDTFMICLAIGTVYVINLIIL